MTNVKKLSIAPRHKFDLVVKAAIMGSTNLKEYITADCSASGISIKSLEKSIPFLEGTIVDLEIPLNKVIKGQNSSIKFLGKVVRVETENIDGIEKKTLCGIKLIPTKSGDAMIWDTLFQILNTPQEKTSPDEYEDTFAFTQRNIA